MLTILFAVICFLYIISASAYWCFHKRWGTVGLNCIAAYVTAASYIFLMRTYLFQSDLLLYILLYAVLVLFLAAALFCENALLIERDTRLFLSGTLLFFNIMLLLYAGLLLDWNTITQELFFSACLASGVSAGIIAGFLFENALIRFSTRCFYLYEQLIKLFVGLCVSLFMIYMLYQFRNITVAAFMFSFLFSFWNCGLHPILIKKIQHYEYRNI